MAEARAAPPPSWADLRKLADAHTVAILAVLIGAPLALVLAYFTRDAGSPVALTCRVAVELVMAAALFRLARFLGEPGPLLWALAPLVHFMLGVIVFAILNMHARRRLGAAGIVVGTLGASIPDVPPQPPAADPPTSS